MKSIFIKLWLAVTVFALVSLGSAFIYESSVVPSCIVVDDVSGMIDGGNDNQNERRKMPPKIKITTDSLCFKGKTIPKSAIIAVNIKNGNGIGIVNGSKNIQHNANLGYDFQMNIGQLNVNVWYNIELTFTHTDGQKIVQAGQIMRINP